MSATRPLVCAAVLLAGLLAAGRPAAAQPPAQNPPPKGEGGAGARTPILTPIELERWFDSYVLLQAQETLKLTDAQFPKFLPRLKSLQDIRRRHLQARRQILLTLAKLVKADPLDEVQVREQMKGLRELDVKAADDMRKAYDGLDEVLDAAQQARFRLFEEQVERRKIDLLMKARQRASVASPPAAGRQR
jgi:Spy/CpxP family protein refolding chaperone